MTMKTAQLGTTGLQITWAGLGAWPIGGGGWEFVWGPQDDDRSIAPVHVAGRSQSRVPVETVTTFLIVFAGSWAGPES